MEFLADLNPEQRDAVLHLTGPLLILAGAGSGKTRVIAYRMAHLIGGGYAEPDEVLAVTFTNKAAGEMRERVERLIGASFRTSWISTFHSLCARLLRREAPAIGLSRDFVIYDSTDQLAAIKQVLRDLQIDDSIFQPRAALSRISHAKNRMETPDQLAAERGGYRDDQFAKVYAGYVRALGACNALDFDDLLLKTVELFEEAEAVRNRYSQRFKQVMVDEYQDTNRPQYLLIRRLAEAHRNLCVVGDPDQSIYKWRGADLRNILDFEQDFPEATIVRLERNYRSTQIILDAASAVIQQNRNRKDKRLWTDRTGGDQIVYCRCNDELEEADFIAEKARSELKANEDSHVAVLYRTNAQSRVIEDALRREGLAYKIIGGVRFYERKEIKDTLAYLKLLINPHDDVSLRRIINVPARGIGKTSLEALETGERREPPSRDALRRPGAGGEKRRPRERAPLIVAAEEPAAAADSMWARLCLALEEERFPPRAAASIRAFRDLVVALTGMAASETVSIAIGKVLDQSGYLQDLRDERSDDAEGRIENLAELVSAAREYETRDPEATLGGFVDQLSLLSDADEEEGSKDARILMMTLHTAKGLEFPAVFIAGLEEGLFPHSRSIDDVEELEEERRLCYVGMTRARSKLFLTGAARRRVFGEYRASEPSRFIDEIPAGLVEHEVLTGSTPYQGSFVHTEFRANPYGRSGFRGRRRGRTDEVHEEAFAYEHEDQTTGAALGPGMRVRHPQFGVGTVLSVEQMPDDLKLTVRFAAVGQKRLLAKYAKLEVV
jgi:DNA helicase-2/ATP-dependent DNA helicase PcrA